VGAPSGTFLVGFEDADEGVGARLTAVRADGGTVDAIVLKPPLA
jgi:hypothetical protein